MKFVEMIHPDVEKPGLVPESAVAHWEQKGWQRTGAAPEPSPDETKTRKRTTKE